MQCVGVNLEVKLMTIGLNRQVSLIVSKPLKTRRKLVAGVGFEPTTFGL
jgi:hypothetical protein